MWGLCVVWWRYTVGSALTQGLLIQVPPLHYVLKPHFQLQQTPLFVWKCLNADFVHKVNQLEPCCAPNYTQKLQMNTWHTQSYEKDISKEFDWTCVLWLEFRNHSLNLRWSRTQWHEINRTQTDWGWIPKCQTALSSVAAEALSLYCRCKLTGKGPQPYFCTSF